MFLNQSRRFAICSVAFVLALSVGVLDAYGQCGVYMKRLSTQMFPFAKVSIDKAADMTGDGVPDLIASGEHPTPVLSRDKFYIFRNHGDGTFAAPTIITPPAGSLFSTDYLVGRVNNDGLNDIIAWVDQSQLLIYLNNGNGTFTPQASLDGSQIGKPIDFFDINADGFGDYFGFVGGSTSFFRYSLGNGNGTFAAPVTINTGRIGYRGDFNGDGKMEFVNARDLYINDGNLNFTSTDISSLFIPNDYINSIQDLNGDGKSDILVSNSFASGNTFAILTSTGTGFTRTHYPAASEPNWGGLTFVGNFSGNAAPDIVHSARMIGKKAVFTNDGAGNFTRQEYTGRFVRSFSPKWVVGDFDVDGKTDIVMGSSALDNSRLLIRDMVSISFLKNVCEQPGEPSIVDFDRSGSTDYSYWNPANGNWSVQTNADSLSVFNVVNWGLGSLGDIPAPGDFDGDGITDRAVYRDSTGIWYIRRSSDQVWFTLAFGAPGDKPVAADYDGDTISDIAVWRPSNGTWYIWYMGPQQFAAVRWGADGDKPVPADFDGDMKTDVAVYRPSTGVWYYLKTSDRVFAAIPWGVGTDAPVAADFDGDAKADISVYRPSNNILYVLRSYDSSAFYYPYGFSTDILQIGDYDGDFVADVGVYRPSNTYWYTTVVPFWAASIFGGPGAVPTSSIR